MPSYVVAGASRGIGLEFVAQLSKRPESVVFALARNPDKSAGLQALQAAASNVHLIKADITDAAALQTAADIVAAKTGGSLDMLVNNAIHVSEQFSFIGIDEYPTTEDLLHDFRTSFETNVIGYVLTTNAFLPLLKRGTLKKVLSISSGMADPECVRTAEYAFAPAYGVTKMAVEMVMVKYAVKYKADGFVFLTVSPGVIKKTESDFGHLPPEIMKKLQEMRQAFLKYAPDWKGPIDADESVRMILSVIDNATLEDSGKFLSHKGDRQWL